MYQIYVQSFFPEFKIKNKSNLTWWKNQIFHHNSIQCTLFMFKVIFLILFQFLFFSFWKKKNFISFLLTMLIHEGVLALDIFMGMDNTAKESHDLKVTTLGWEQWVMIRPLLTRDTIEDYLYSLLNNRTLFVCIGKSFVYVFFVMFNSMWNPYIYLMLTLAMHW